MMAGSNSRAATEDEIIAMSRAKVGDEAIVARIENDPCLREIEAADIEMLRKVGVSSRVVAALIRRCASGSNQSDGNMDPRDPITLRPGVYLVSKSSTWTRYINIIPAIAGVSKSGATGAGLLFPAKSKISLPGSSAALGALSGEPVFWIALDPAKDRKRNVEIDSSAALPGYEDIRLVQLEPKAGKRQLQVGASANGFVLSGVDPKRSIPISVSRKSRSIYAITVTRALPPGEYALLASDSAYSYRLYDFSIR